MVTPAPVTFVVSHLEPAYGIERAAADLITALSRTRPVEVVVVGGPVPARLGEARVVGMGLRSRGTGRLLNVPRLRHLGTGPGVTVLVGAWTAVPWLLANLGGSGSRRVVVWEHSFTAVRVATVRKIRRLWPAARTLYRRSALVVVPGPATLQVVADSIPGPVRVIPNISTTTDTGDQAPPSRAGVLLVGRLEPVKRVDLALRAFAASSATRLTIVGDGTDRAALQSLARELGIADRVLFLGKVPRDRVLGLMREAQVLLHTPQDETFGLVYLEAASCELPVVSTTHLAAADLIPDVAPGLLADDSASSIGATLDDALDRDHASWGWDEAHRLRARRFDADTIVHHWNAALDGLR